MSTVAPVTAEKRHAMQRSKASSAENANGPILRPAREGNGGAQTPRGAANAVAVAGEAAAVVADAASELAGKPAAAAVVVLAVAADAGETSPASAASTAAELARALDREAQTASITLGGNCFVMLSICCSKKGGTKVDRTHKVGLQNLSSQP